MKEEEEEEEEHIVISTSTGRCVLPRDPKIASAEESKWKKNINEAGGTPDYWTLRHRL